MASEEDRENGGDMWRERSSSPWSLHAVFSAENQETQHHEGVFAAMVANIETMPLLCRDILHTNVKMARKHAYGLNIYDLEYEGLTPFPGIF